MRRLLLFITLFTSLMMAISPALAQEASTPEAICEAAVPAEDPANRTFSEPEQVLEAGVDYRAVFCTDAGAVYIDLLEEYAPVTVNNFIFLAQQGYYNNTTFHRVIADFMAQGGDPDGTGTGGPGYQFEDEFAGFLNFDQAGWLAMANAGPGTNGSQFFITTAPTQHLNFLHTIFGEVLQGQENVEAIELRDPQTATEPGTTLNTVVIIEDPSTVETTFEPVPPASQDEVTEAFEQLTSMLPPDVLAIDEETSGIYSTEEWAAQMPEEIQSDYADFLSSHNHEYTAANTIVNVACDLTNVPFISISYELETYASAEDAQAALTDPAVADLMTARGFTENTSENGSTLYSRESTACDSDVITTATRWQRGRFVATPQITLNTGVEVPIDEVLESFVGQQIYEQILSSILRPEIR